MKVAFQGERGAFSESAVYDYFGQSVEVQSCRNLSDVFQSIQNDDTEFGVVPIENSLEGSVNQTYDLFLEYDLKVCGEIVIRIVHCLIAHPGTRLDSIKTVYSHPQALGQCRKFLEKLGVKLIPTFDTAGSVKMIEEDGLKDAAAVASEKAAEIYGMKVLVREIEDNPNNYTRFFVLSKADSPFSGTDKTSIIFSGRNVPGLLYRVLGEFTRRNIDLTKIESRPTKKMPWEYNFYLDFKGHRTEERCRETLESLEAQGFFVKVLGSYKAAKGWF